MQFIFKGKNGIKIYSGIFFPTCVNECFFHWFEWNHSSSSGRHSWVYSTLCECYVCKLLVNFEPHNSLKRSLTNIWGLRSNFVECESFLESNSPDTLPVCETNLDDSIDSGNFSVGGYLSLVRKDSVTHIHGLAVYMKEGLPFARDLSPENSADSYLCFRLALLHSMSYFFFLYRWTSSLLCTVFFILFHTWMGFSWSTHLLMCLFLGTLVFIIRTD